jgi:hypothetical protein
MGAAAAPPGQEDHMHVRVCTECGEEYRPEIAVCADCGGALEDRHDDGPEARDPGPGGAEGGREPDSDEGFTDPVLRADGVNGLTEAADRLAEQGIGFRIRPARRGGAEHASGYRLLVAPEDREEALGALGLLAPERAGGEARHCPACETAIPPGALECPECGLAAGDDPNQATCARCGHWLDGPACPECGT